MAEKYEIKDFIEFEPEISEEWQKLKVKFKHSVGEFKYYKLNKSCLILNQNFEKPLEINVCTDFTLSEYIDQINECIHWIGGECKNDLIEYFNKEMGNFFQEKANNEWYETLTIYSVSISIAKDKELSADIVCGDSIYNGVLSIGIDNNEIAVIYMD